MLTGQNGILNRAAEAKEKTGTAQTEEQVNLATSAALVDGQGSILYTNLNNELKDQFGTGNYTIDPEANANSWNVTIGDNTYKISSIGDVTEKLLITELTGNAKGTTPYLPSKDFTVVDNSFANGVVIKDSSNNEYVWIEVPNKLIDSSATFGPAYPEATTATSYSAIKTALLAYTETLLSATGSDYKTTKQGWLDEWYDSNNKKAGDEGAKLTDTAGCGLTASGYETLYNEMLSSVFENGGFWIGRYETGIKGTEIKETETTKTGVRTYGTAYTELHETTGHMPVIKANVQPYTWVRCNQAQSLASSMESGIYNSSLMFGVQWDMVLMYLKNKETVDDAGLKANSKDWGNHKDKLYNITDTLVSYSTDQGATWLKAPYNKTANGMTLLTTGANKEFKKQNIYDLAGNVFEFTLEYARSGAYTTCALRGGVAGGRGNYGPASNRFVPSVLSSEVYRF